MSDLAEQLIGEEEGRVRTAYPDSRGLMTIGIGCLVDPRVRGAGLCDAAIDAQFSHDSATARMEAARLPNFAVMNPVRQAVLVSMCFQLGDQPLGWHNFCAALQAQDFKAAAAAGRDSDWWRTETRNRAEREMIMLESGQWEPKLS